MPDKLTLLYNSWRETNNGLDPYNAFQGGFTASAFSMRTRVMALIQKANLPNDDKNKLLTAVGTLSDIPA